MPKTRSKILSIKTSETSILKLKITIFKRKKAI